MAEFYGEKTLGEESKGYRVQLYLTNGNVNHHRVKRFGQLREMLKGELEVVEEFDNGGVLVAGFDKDDKNKPFNKHYPNYRGDLAFMDKSDFRKLRP